MVKGYRADRGSRNVSQCTLHGSCSDMCPPHSHTRHRSCKERDSEHTRWRLVCRFGLWRRVCSGRCSRNQRDYTYRHWHMDLRHKDQTDGSSYLVIKNVYDQNILTTVWIWDVSSYSSYTFIHIQFLTGLWSYLTNLVGIYTCNCGCWWVHTCLRFGTGS